MKLRRNSLKNYNFDFSVLILWEELATVVATAQGCLYHSNSFGNRSASYTPMEITWSYTAANMKRHTSGVCSEDTDVPEESTLMLPWTTLSM
jgi:hypothetical protein